MKKLLSLLTLLSLSLSFSLASPVFAKSTAASTAARSNAASTAARTNTLNSLNTITAANAARSAAETAEQAISIAIPSMAEVEENSACGFDDVDPKYRDSARISSDDIANLAWEAEVATAYGTDFSTITRNQLAMIRDVNTRMAIKGATALYLSIHESLVLCPIGFTYLDKNVVIVRGRK